MKGDTPIGPLLKTVFESIFEVFLLCVAGFILARKGILDRPTQKKLNRLNVSLFTPALLFSKVAFFLSPAKLKELWIIPIVFVVTTAVSMVTAFVLGWLFRLKKSQRSFAIASAMFMNSNSLPIALMQSLVVTVPGLKWGDDDNEDAMVGRALTYLVLYSTLGMVVRWSYGVRLLSQADPESSETTNEETAHAPLLDREEVAFPPSEEEAHLHRYKPSSESPETASQTDVEYPSIIVHSSNAADPKFFYSFPNSPQRSTQALQPSSTSSSSSLVQQDEEDEGEDEGLDDGELEIRRRRRRNPLTPSTSRTRSFFRRTSHKLRKAWRTFNEFMTVPLWAALASLLVACIQPLQHTLEEHVEPVKGALTQAGNVSIPLTLVVLGAYFYTPLTPEQRRESLPRHQPSTSTSTSASALAEEQEAERGRSRSELSLVDNVREMFKMGVRNASRDWRRRKQMNKEAKRPGETKTVVVAILSRMILTPLLLLPLMAVGARWDLQEVFADPVFVVSNVLLIASPPALTLAQITQAASGDAFERLISRTIFWSYCVVTPPSTIIFVVIGLVLSKL